MAERIRATELNRRPGEIIARVERGESFELTRHGKPIARLLPPEVATTQADLPIAGSPQIRPTQQINPLEASRQRARTAQHARDNLLRGGRRSG